MVSIFYYTGPYLVPILEKNRSLFGPYRDQIGVGMTLGHTAPGPHLIWAQEINLHPHP